MLVEFKKKIRNTAAVKPTKWVILETPLEKCVLCVYMV